MVSVANKLLNGPGVVSTVINIPTSGVSTSGVSTSQLLAFQLLVSDFFQILFLFGKIREIKIPFLFEKIREMNTQRRKLINERSN